MPQKIESIIAVGIAAEAPPVGELISVVCAPKGADLVEARGEGIAHAVSDLAGTNLKRFEVIAHVSAPIPEGVLHWNVVEWRRVSRWKPGTPSA